MMLDGFDSEHMKQAVRRSRMAHNRGPQEEEEWKPALSEQAPQLTAVAAAASGPGGWPGTAHSSSIRAGRADRGCAACLGRQTDCVTLPDALVPWDACSQWHAQMATRRRRGGAPAQQPHHPQVVGN